MSGYRYCDDTEAHGEHEWIVWVEGLGSNYYYCVGVDDSAELVAANRVVAERRREVEAAQALLDEATAAAGAVAWKNRTNNALHFDEPEHWARVPGVWRPRDERR